MALLGTDGNSHEEIRLQLCGGDRQSDDVSQGSHSVTGSPISNQEGKTGQGTGNTGGIMLGAEQPSSVHPVLVSQATAESCSSFQQEPPRW